MTLRSPRFFSAPGMVVDLLLAAVVLRLTKTRFLLLSESNVCRTNFGTLFTHS